MNPEGANEPLKRIVDLSRLPQDKTEAAIASFRERADKLKNVVEEGLPVLVGATSKDNQLILQRD